MADSAIEITNLNFEEKVTNNEIPVLIDFWAEWCAPCKMIAPAIDEIAVEYKGKEVIGKEAIDSGVCAIAAFYDDQINETLGVDGEDQFTVYVGTLGKKR